MADCSTFVKADTLGSVPQTSKLDAQSILEEFCHRYTDRNALSLAQFKQDGIYMPGANTRSVLHALPFPMVIARGQATTVWSVDGHSYIDFLSEYSAGLYGHSCERIWTAVNNAMKKGWNLGGKNAYEGKLAQMLVERFGNSMDMIRFCNSGTEANLMAIGTAIAYTGKQKILCFLGGYHGSSISFPEASPCYTMNPKYEFVLAPYNDILATDAAVGALPPNSLAAIIVEGMQGAGGCISGRPDFMQHLQKLAREYGALFILDEVMTSRLAYGGLQSTLGIKPDITTLGKWPGGGFSFGAFGGRHAVMEMLDPSAKKLVHSGTFNNNTISMAGGIEGCNIFDREAVKGLNDLGDTLRQRISDVLKQSLGHKNTSDCNEQANGAVGSASKIYISGVGSLMNVTFTGVDKDIWQAIFYHYMLEQGLYIATRGYVALNLETRVEHLDIFVRAIEKFVTDYQDLF